MKSKRLEIILAVALVVLVVSAFATTWTQNTNSGGPTWLGMSADGRIICAVPSTSSGTVISTNWGQTWTVVTNASNSLSPVVAVSADGSQIFFRSFYTYWSYTNASEGFESQLLVSTNYGNTWRALLTTNSTGVAVGVGPVARSADGTKLIASVGSIFFSTNGGADWYTSSSPTGQVGSLASSATGQLMAAAVYTGNSGIYLSTDFGATWTPTSPPGGLAVCVSADGKSVGVSSGYISSNGGINWRTTKIGGNSIACSANGSNWIIGGQQGVYTSLDGGVTWQTNFPGQSWDGSAVSADGRDFAIVGAGGIAIGRNTPSPQLSIQSADQSVNLSWLIPSTNFVLQQNSDLTTTDWTDVSNSPVLNFTNLQQQVSVPSSSSNTFFRLIAQ